MVLTECEVIWTLTGLCHILICHSFRDGMNSVYCYLYNSFLVTCDEGNFDSNLRWGRGAQIQHYTSVKEAMNESPVVYS